MLAVIPAPEVHFIEQDMVNFYRWDKADAASNILLPAEVYVRSIGVPCG